MSGDPYIRENDELRAEIDRLQESVNYLQIADNHHQELMAEKEDEIDRLRAALEEIVQIKIYPSHRTAWDCKRIARKALANKD